MRLTPLDIRKQEFKRSMRGLDIDEVRAFLATVADEYEAVINDNKALRDRLLELDDKVQEYRNMEKTLRDTLLTAERVTVEAKENARREAELIVKEARIEAERAGRDVRNSALKLHQEIQTLKQQKESYLSRLRVLIESHMKFVDSADRDMREEERRLEVEQRDFESKRQPQAAQPEPPKRDSRDTVTQGFAGASPDHSTAERGEGRVGLERGPERLDGRPSAERSESHVGSAQSEQTESRVSSERTDNRLSPERGESRGMPDRSDARLAAEVASEATPGWSLDRLKRDILAGTGRSDEEDR